jgi:hypothetical protein
MASAPENTLIDDCRTWLDRKMIKDGVQYHEKKGLQRVFKEDGVEMSILSRRWFHMRSIGDRTYTVNHNLVDGVGQETIDTNLAEDEVAEFKWQFTVAFQSFDMKVFTYDFGSTYIPFHN